MNRLVKVFVWLWVSLSLVLPVALPAKVPVQAGREGGRVPSAPSILFPTNGFGGVTSIEVFLQAYSNHPLQFSYGGRTCVSHRALLCSLLVDTDIAQELELTSEQRPKLKNLLKKLTSTERELVTRCDAFSDASRSEKRKMVEWVVEAGRQFDSEAEQTLLPHQFEILSKIHTNYLVGAVGWKRVIEYSNKQGLLNLSNKTLTQLQKQEKQLVNELRDRCRQFSHRQIRRITDVLNESQRKRVGTVLQQSRFVEFPELLAACAELYIADDSVMRMGGGDALYSEWGSRTSWTLCYDGTFRPKIRQLDGYGLEYLVTALVHDRSLHQKLELLDLQTEALLEVTAELKQRDKQLAAQIQGLSQQSNDYRSLVKAWKQAKRAYVLEELNDLLLPFQVALLNKETELIRLRRLGVFAFLAGEPIRGDLGMTTNQLAKIREIAKTLPSDCARFSRKTFKWFLEQLAHAVDNERERDSLTELFDASYRSATVPMGCLVQALGRRHKK